MINLTPPGTKILYHGNEMMKHLATHTDHGYTKEQLGLLVKFYGGDKIIKTQNKLLICSVIEEANYEQIG